MSHVRAVGVALLVLWAFVAALPMPGPGSARALQDPTAQRELRDWTRILGSVGVAVTPDALGAWVLEVGAVARAGQAAVTWPVRPVVRQLAIQQGWGLFAYPDQAPHVFVIEGDAGDGDYRTIYRSLHPKANWKADLIAYRRVRAMINPGRKVPSTYAGAVEHLAALAFQDHPAWTRVRVRFERIGVRVPGSPEPKTSTSRRFERVVERAP